MENVIKKRVRACEARFRSDALLVLGFLFLRIVERTGSGPTDVDALARSGS
jgi:hypothetical protein